MTLSLYSTYKAWRRDVAAERGDPSGIMDASPPSGIQTALSLFGLGIGGIGGGGDPSMPDGV